MFNEQIENVTEILTSIEKIESLIHSTEEQTGEEVQKTM